MSNGYNLTKEQLEALYGNPTLEQPGLQYQPALQYSTTPVPSMAGTSWVPRMDYSDALLAQQYNPSAILEQGQQAAMDQNIAAMKAGLDVSTPEAQSGRTKKPLTMDQKLALRAGTEILGTTAAQAAQLGLMKLPTEATKYVAERLSEIRALKAKGYPLSPEQERLFAEGEARIAQQADAGTRALLANQQVSGGRSAQDMMNVQKGTQATMAAAQADLTAKKAAEKAAAAENMRKEEEGLVAFVDAQQTEFRDKIGQLAGGLAPILGQVFEAQGIKEQPQVEGTSPEEMKFLVDLYAKDPEAFEKFMGLLPSESGA
jgi:hypothetical protein